jgi:hypothetical protein
MNEYAEVDSNKSEQSTLNWLWSNVTDGIDGVKNHFGNIISNVAKGEASTGEYLEVGAIAVGTAAAAKFGVGRLMQRGATGALVEGRAAGAISERDLVRKLVGGEVARKDAPFVFGKNMESLGTIPAANGGKTLGFTIKERPTQFSNLFAEPGTNMFRSARPFGEGFVRTGKDFGSTVADAEFKIIPLNPAAARLQIALNADAATSGRQTLELVKPLASDGSAYQITLPAGRSASMAGLRPPEWESIVKMPHATDEGLTKMFPSLWNNHKLTLNFRSSKVSDDGLRTIAELKGRVGSLDIRNTQVTRSGYTWIQKELPDALVTW